VLFNLFPGMGAWNLVIRKAGFAVANEMILSGKLYSAEQLQHFRLVDAVVDDGEGEAAIDEVLAGVHPRLRGTLAALEARRLASPITYEMLSEVVELWTRTALTLTDRDLRLMERLVRAQARRAGDIGADGAVAEIKRMELDTAWGEEKTGITEWGDLR
jgi:DSF synthase